MASVDLYENCVGYRVIGNGMDFRVKVGVPRGGLMPECPMRTVRLKDLRIVFKCPPLF
ncbi:hypothetical protein [Vulcanisaeta distributa]|uniref:hypothetical protein n=1 Tax=Vulcanisaeta distributa TaxID=164451 RepID=UPI001FB50A20|nr:hypothetical protein [Vulcanisaeta distributa]